MAEMGLRMVFSALCDADFLDTAAHFAATDPVTRPAPAVRADADFTALRDRLRPRERSGWPTGVFGLRWTRYAKRSTRHA